MKNVDLRDVDPVIPEPLHGGMAPALKVAWVLGLLFLAGSVLYGFIK